MIVVQYIYLIFVFICHGELIHFNHRSLTPGIPDYLVISKYGKQEVPNWEPGRGRSFIDMSRVLVSSGCSTLYAKSCKNSTLEALFFESPTDKTSWTELWDGDNLCCTEDNKKCSKIGSLIIPSDLPGHLYQTAIITATSYPIELFGEESSAHYEIKSSGQYVLITAVCDDHASSVVIDGTIESVNPYGYLPADLFGDLPFYGTLSCLYIIIGVTWAILCRWYSDQLLPLQHWISAVIVIGMIETNLIFAGYVNWNDVGTQNVGLYVSGLAFGVLKRALSRILVLLVALGYGVVRVSLGDDMNRALYLGGSYFVLSLTYTLLVNAPTNSKAVGDTEYDFISFLVFILAIIDTTFYIWIFASINNLLEVLAIKKQGVKYLLYKNFRTVLIVLLFCTCVWALYGSVIVLNAGGGSNSHWRVKWTLDALWELIYFAIMIAIALLWAPSKNSQRYAYSAELSQLEDDEEFQSASKGNDDTEDNDEVPIGLPSRSTKMQAGSKDSNGIEMKSKIKFLDDDLDGEYGGKLEDEQDPFVPIKK